MTKQDLSKMSLTACISIILTGGAAWFAFGRDVTTRPEVEAMIAQSLVPITLSANANAAQTMELRSSVTELVKAQQGLVVEQRVLIERVNTLVERMGK
jgi:hypothetical protein